MSRINSQIEIFHGSTRIIQAPQYGLGNEHNDYGKGFYCTRSEELAREWACPEPRDGFANRYSLDVTGLDVLDLQSPEYHILNWLAILLENRVFDLSHPLPRSARDYIIKEFLPDYKQRDIIIGYRADDSYFSFARNFVSGGLSLSSLSKAMMLGALGEQVCLKSEKSFNRLKYMDTALANGFEYYVKRSARDSRTRKEYLAMREDVQLRDAVFVIDIIRQEWKNDDERLR